MQTEKTPRPQAQSSIIGLRARRQRVWSWPAVVTLSLVGTGAGLYILSTVLSILPRTGRPAAAVQHFKLLSPVLAFLGFLMLLLEAGRPLRGRFLLRGLAHSWMSREVVAGALFITTAALDCWLSIPWLWAVAALAAFLLIVSQGFMLYRAVGVCSWSRACVPLLHVSSSLALGGGLALLVAWAQGSAGHGLLATNLMVVAFDLGVWLFYMRSITAVGPYARAMVLRQRLWQVMIVGLGHAMPLVLLLPGLAMSAGDKSVAPIAGAAGLCIMAGGLALKVYLLRGAAFLRQLALAVSPTQGQGKWG